MDYIEILKKLGLNESQAKAYLALVGNDNLTPPDLAVEIGEKRTATYMILARLEELGLASKAEGSRARYIAESPTKLKEILVAKQSEHQQLQRSLISIMPALNAEYNIAYQKPGVVYMEGIQGLKYVYNEIIDNGEDIMLLPSQDVFDNSELVKLIEGNVEKQRKRGINTRTIYPKTDKAYLEAKKHTDANVSVRYFGNSSMQTAQIILYANTVAITTFQPGIFNTVITNPLLANTFKGYFEDMWAAGEC
ncbi:MAG: helix-turn-helix domain-containing protein [Candidatus Saccharibacteria bacterium]